MRRIGNCSICGGVNTYGILFIRDNNVLYGCDSCQKTHLRALPPLKKKIIYLDQCFLSKVFRKSDSEFIKVSATLARLAQYLALVCPYSTIHETETHQWRSEERAELFKFIKRFSRGHDFEADYEVEMTQLQRSYEAFLKGASPAIELVEQDAIPKDVHQWDDFFWIDAKKYVEDAELIRSLKNQVVERMVTVIDEWRKESLSFEELFEQEGGAWKEGVMNAFIKALKDPMSFLDQPILSEYLMRLTIFRGEGGTPEEQLNKMMEYMKSDYIKHIPFVEISSKIHALLRYKVQQGQFSSNVDKIKKIISGLYFDAKFISVYAPYCDAMFVDNLMHQWLVDEKINIQAKYPVKIYSKSNLSNFKGYLEGIERDISEEQKKIVNEIY